MVVEQGVFDVCVFCACGIKSTYGHICQMLSSFVSTQNSYFACHAKGCRVKVFMNVVVVSNSLGHLFRIRFPRKLYLMCANGGCKVRCQKKDTMDSILIIIFTVTITIIIINIIIIDVILRPVKAEQFHFPIC